MASTWEKVDPDQAFDDLPEPYRTINKVLDDVLIGVDENIKAFESKRKSESAEYNLPQALPSMRQPVAGVVTSAFAETRVGGKVAIGTSLGEVAVLEACSCEVAGSIVPPFQEGEAVSCVTLCTDAAYHSFYTSAPQLAAKYQGPPRPSPKLAVVGSVTPSIFVYSIYRNPLAHGLLLAPACIIDLPPPEVKKSAAAAPPEPPPDPKGKKGAPPPAPVAAEEPEEPAIVPSPVEQLHMKGVQGAVWVIALLWDRTIRAYLCPLGDPENEVATKTESMTEIPEENDEEESPRGAAAGEEFSSAIKISTPKYSISVPTMVAMPGLAEPGLERLTLSIFAPRHEGTGRGRTTAKVPTFCYLTSEDSNAVYAYSLRPPSLNAELESLGDGTDAAKVDALLQRKAAPMGEVKEPSAAESLLPQRRWMMPARTTATAISPNGGVFGAGGSQGTIALINATAGPSLRTVVPGHYAAVTGLAFYKAEVLISVGADSWVHVFDMNRSTFLSRSLLSPPPSPPPGAAIAALPGAALSVALDTEGNIRLLDCQRGGKLARVHCREPDEFGNTGFEAAPPGSATSSSSEAQPSQVLATATGFCIVCNRRPAAPATAQKDIVDDLVAEGEERAAAAATSEDVVEAEPSSEEIAGKLEESFLVYFDQSSLLCSLFPGLAARKENGESVVEVFNSPDVTKEEMMRPPPPEPVFEQTMASRPSMGGSRASMGGSRPSALLQGSTAGSSAGGRSPGGRSPGGKSRESIVASQVQATPAKLTAENLRAIGRRDRSGSIAASEPRSVGFSDAGGSSKKQRPSAVATRKLSQPAASNDCQGVPDFWQVGVRRNLRRCLEDKSIRQAAITKHLDAIRKEVEGT